MTITATDDLQSLSTASREYFVKVLGAIFEHSPWVAESAWSARPFASIDALHAAMVAAVDGAGEARQLALICAHPELAGKEADAGTLTQDSRTEQSGAGLDRCSPEELARLRALNLAYREKFGFPFVIAVKHLTRQDVLDALATRIGNSRKQELATCLTEIGKIGRLRLDALLGNKPALNRLTAGRAAHLSAQRIWDHCEMLAACSETPGALTRVYLSEQQRAANALVRGWMLDAGMTTRFDAIGNIIGRYEGTESGRPCLMLGSHLDTVRDAGKYDGMLGVVAAIECVHALHNSRKRLEHAIEVIGFADEEGVRFSASLLGSRAVAGTFDFSALDKLDRNGISMRDALSQFGLDPANIARAARKPGDVAAYVELHIEQGPVLEAEGLPVGVVTAICGANRFIVDIQGMAGHAGTVPMVLRKDALAAAAECVLAIEALARSTTDLVATVGQLEAFPGATNVVPGRVRFTIDLRSPRDDERSNAADVCTRTIENICAQRGVAITISPTHVGKTADCTPWLMDQVGTAISAEGIPVRRLPSGAGHDGMAMIDLTDIAMLFVRCKAGISHNPAEAISLDDIDLSTRVLLRFIENFTPQSSTGKKLK
jgi:allantoate deiminase/N-carbamoyl-L-amino-acid hydrolase